ncbi:Hypothetical protein CINCED_3A018864 [Cinara cedri]|nr:Hypothetical protein CINCED_3A018864 [Cinara cedri]
MRTSMVETTSYGAALAAGIAVGVWNINAIKSDCDTFSPTISEEEQTSKYHKWKEAIYQSVGWSKNDEEEDDCEGFLNH